MHARQGFDICLKNISMRSKAAWDHRYRRNHMDHHSSVEGVQSNKISVIFSLNSTSVYLNKPRHFSILRHPLSSSCFPASSARRSGLVCDGPWVRTHGHFSLKIYIVYEAYILSQKLQCKVIQ